jgi:hypothetical protein
MRKGREDKILWTFHSRTGKNGRTRRLSTQLYGNGDYQDFAQGRAFARQLYAKYHET